MTSCITRCIRAGQYKLQLHTTNSRLLPLSLSRRALTFSLGKPPSFFVPTMMKSTPPIPIHPPVTTPRSNNNNTNTQSPTHRGTVQPNGVAEVSPSNQPSAPHHHHHHSQCDHSSHQQLSPQIRSTPHSPVSSGGTILTYLTNPRSSIHGLHSSSSSPSLVDQDRDSPSHSSFTPPLIQPQSPTTPSFQSPSPASYTDLHPCRQVSFDGTRSELRFMFDNNRDWAKNVERQYPGFFNALKNQQKPKYMWIGCSDSRVPATEITGLMPGEVFVHRNVANCVQHADLNLLSCLQLAVDVLKVEHIIVCGHYGCGGINFALQPTQVGLADNWIRHIKDVARTHAKTLSMYETFEQKSWALAELHVVAQVENVCHTTIVQNAWRRSQPLAVHGWIYGVHNGLLNNLVEPSIKGFDQVSPAFHVRQQDENNTPSL